jgi:type VI secretion system protein ImpA
MIVPEVLLAPVPGDVPEGIDLRNPSRRPPLYDALTALRSARQRDEAADPAFPADWVAVENLCSAILTNHSKDMEAAAGLTEALVHNHGFAGLAAGGKVVAGLTEQFWSGLFPAPEEDETNVSAEAARLQPLIHLVDDQGRLLPAVRRVILFTLDDGCAFSYSDCLAAKAWTALRPDDRAKRLAAMTQDERAARENAAGTRLWDTVQLAFSGNRNGVLAETRREVAAALEAWRGVAAAVLERAGEGRFSCQAVLDLLEDVSRTMTQLAPEAAAAHEDTAAEAIPTQPGSSVGLAVQALASREDALRQLAEITAFFRRTEPYSPVAYTLEEAVRRARLAWPEWLAEIVPDRQQRDAILTRLGLRPDPGNG